MDHPQEPAKVTLADIVEARRKVLGINKLTVVVARAVIPQVEAAIAKAGLEERISVKASPIPDQPDNVAYVIDLDRAMLPIEDRPLAFRLADPAPRRITGITGA